jgi:uncharacterized protein (TIRG00374 family)
MFEILSFAISWRFLLNFLSLKLTVFKSFLYVWYGIFMDIIIPAESISGEISRVYLFTKENRGTSGKVIASLVVHRMMGMGINIASLLLGATVLLVRGHLGGTLLTLTFFLALVTTFFLVLLVFLSVKEEWTLKVIDAFLRLVIYLSRGRWKLTKVKNEISKAVKIFHESINEFRHASKSLIPSLSLNIFSWLCSFTVAYLVFLSVNYPVEWSVIVITSSIMVAVKSIPLGIPFEMGLPEITTLTLYVIFGIPPDISATVTILNRILTLWLKFFIGFGVYQWFQIKILSKQL